MQQDSTYILCRKKNIINPKSNTSISILILWNIWHRVPLSAQKHRKRKWHISPYFRLNSLYNVSIRRNLITDDIFKSLLNTDLRRACWEWVVPEFSLIPRSFVSFASRIEQALNKWDYKWKGNIDNISLSLFFPERFTSLSKKFS